jgi:hypothetical protein
MIKKIPIYLEKIIKGGSGWRKFARNSTNEPNEDEAK